MHALEQRRAFLANLACKEALQQSVRAPAPRLLTSPAVAPATAAPAAAECTRAAQGETSSVGAPTRPHAQARTKLREGGREGARGRSKPATYPLPLPPRPPRPPLPPRPASGWRSVVAAVAIAGSSPSSDSVTGGPVGASPGGASLSESEPSLPYEHSAARPAGFAVVSASFCALARLSSGPVSFCCCWRCSSALCLCLLCCLCSPR